MVTLNSDITINGKLHKKGEVLAWYKVYPFFLFHMLAFGLSGFFMAYATDGPSIFFLYAHGGFAILTYLLFYFVLFGRDQVKWMFINAGLGILGIYSQIGWILDVFNKRIENYPISVHVIPFLYYILYTFLLYQCILDMTGSNESEDRKKKVDFMYVATSLVIYGGSLVFL